jgi:ribosome modulation factor
MLSEELLAWKTKRIRSARRRGFMARIMGQFLHQNPYGSLEEQEGDAWEAGWKEGSRSVHQLQRPYAA